MWATMPFYENIRNGIFELTAELRIFGLWAREMIDDLNTTPHPDVGAGPQIMTRREFSHYSA